MMDPLMSSLKKRERRDGSTLKNLLVLSGNEDSCKEQAKGVSQAESLDNRDEHFTTCGVLQPKIVTTKCSNHRVYMIARLPFRFMFVFRLSLLILFLCFYLYVHFVFQIIFQMEVDV